GSDDEGYRRGVYRSWVRTPAGGTKRKTSGVQGGGDGLQDALFRLLQAGLDDGAGGEAVAAAAERLGDLRHVNPGARAEADLHAALGLLHEEQRHLDAGHAADVVDQVLGVLRRRAGLLVVGAAQLAEGDQAVRRHLDAAEHQPGQP